MEEEAWNSGGIFAIFSLSGISRLESVSLEGVTRPGASRWLPQGGLRGRHSGVLQTQGAPLCTTRLTPRSPPGSPHPAAWSHSQCLCTELTHARRCPAGSVFSCSLKRL